MSVKIHRYPRRILAWDERGRVKLPPVDGPRPQPKPGLPSLPPGGGSERPTLDLLPSGPVDPRAPLPWDDYTYPPISPASDAIYEAYRADEERIVRYKRWLGREKKEKKREKKKLPAPAPDRPALPSGGYVAEARESVRDPEASGLLGPTPLELYDQYLQAQGIRYFNAHELTTHRWRHTKQIAPRIGGKRSSAWSRFYEEFEPKIAPRGVHFLLAECVVPHPDLWPSILPALIVLDRFRHWLNKPVRGISAYRLPWYNRQIEGSPHSYHMHNAAVDFTYADRTASGHIDTELFVRFVETLYPQSGDGIGRYGITKGNFIHYDRDMHRERDKRKWLDWWFPTELKGVLS